MGKLVGNNLLRRDAGVALARQGLATKERGRILEARSAEEVAPDLIGGRLDRTSPSPSP